MKLSRSWLYSALVGALVLAAPAAAGARAPGARPKRPAPVSTTPAPVSTTPATGRPAPATGRLVIRLEKVNGNQPVVVDGDTFRVRGFIRPYVAGQRVTVSFAHVNRVVLRRTARVLLAKNGSGFFLLQATLHTPGTMTVTAASSSVPATPTTPAGNVLHAGAPNLRVFPRYISHGSNGPFVYLMQQLLAREHYAIGLSGRFDAQTMRAVLAFRKETNLGRNDAADLRFLRALVQGRGYFPVRYPGHGKHFEADLAHQVLAEIDPGGRVRRVYVMSSGKPSTPTVVGHFHIYSKDPGTNAKGMVHSNYFIGGYAIHGYAEVPPYAASHGCLRIPIPDSQSVFNWARIGDAVDVYTHGNGGSRHVSGNAGP